MYTKIAFIYMFSENDVTIDMVNRVYSIIKNQKKGSTTFIVNPYYEHIYLIKL